MPSPLLKGDEMEYKIGDIVKIKNTSLYHKNQIVKITELGTNKLGDTIVLFDKIVKDRKGMIIGIPTKHLCQTVTIKFGG